MLLIKGGWNTIVCLKRNLQRVFNVVKSGNDLIPCINDGVYNLVMVLINKL